MNVTIFGYAPEHRQYGQYFARFFEKFWPNQPYRVVVTSGSWSDGIASHFRDNPTQASVILLEDYILSDRVDPATMALCWSYIEDDASIGFVRLNPCPGPSLPYDPILGMFDHGAEYLTSLQPCIWRIDCLLELLRPGESAWDFELRGTERARSSRWAFLGTRQNLMSHQNLIRRGAAVPEVMQWIEGQA